MAFYCWSCYGRNDRATGPCTHCGEEISPPSEATETQRLIWALRHPDPDVAIVSARRLGAEADRSAIPALREVIDRPPDPYVAGQALHSLLELSTVDQERELLQRLAADSPFMLRRQAEQALTETPQAVSGVDEAESGGVDSGDDEGDPGI